MPKTKQRRFYLFLSLLLLGLVVSLLADYVLPFGPYDQDLTRALQPPDAIHWLGTDRYGRDLLSRTLSGAKTTVCTALAVALAAGSTLGNDRRLYHARGRCLDRLAGRHAGGGRRRRCAGFNLGRGRHRAGGRLHRPGHDLPQWPGRGRTAL